MNINTMKKQKPNPRREDALNIVHDLCRHMCQITADLVYDALAANGFREDERVRLTGAVLRTAQARQWITASPNFTRSAKNHSNLQVLWNSNLLEPALSKGEITKNDLAAKYEKWTQAGLQVPMALAYNLDQHPENVSV